MYKIQLTIDDHEKKITPFFAEIKMPDNVEYNVTRIEYGDYAVCYRDKILFIIERKTWGDLSSSISDGRKDNVNKMIKIREDTGCKLFYLIEGNPCPPKNAKFGRKPVKSLQAHLDHLIFRDNISVIYSRTAEKTCARILQLIKNFTTMDPSPIDLIDNELDESDVDAENKPVSQTLEKGGDKNGNDKKGGNALKRLKIIVRKSDETIIYNIWCCVPNITEKSASLFTGEYHISDLILGNIPKETIRDKKYASGAVIGLKRSNVIWKCSRNKKENNPIFINMLMQINGITKKTAIILLEKTEWGDLLDGKLNVTDIAGIKKTESGRKIGNKVASDILKYFVKESVDPSPDM